MAEAIEWLIGSGARILAIPLGEAVQSDQIVRQMERGAQRGVRFFAAAGNLYPEPLLFPARHPLAIAADFQGRLIVAGSRGSTWSRPVGKYPHFVRNRQTAILPAQARITALFSKYNPKEEDCP